MDLFWFSALLVIFSNVGYHICQKSIPPAANPLLSVIVTFALALLVSVALYFFLPGERGIISGLKNLNAASFVLGLTIIGIEVGYLLVYRSGWNISLGPVFINLVVLLILIPVGLLLFNEKITVKNLAGVVFAVIGIYLITGK
jgi:drug/metabolite transporter (DMT)-like permease